MDRLTLSSPMLSPRLRNFVAIDPDAPVTTEQLTAIFGGDVRALWNIVRLCLRSRDAVKAAA